MRARPPEIIDFALDAHHSRFSPPTAGYTDPVLVNRKPRLWDLAAERDSVGITLYEMALGEGVLPQWSDGSHPLDQWSVPQTGRLAGSGSAWKAGRFWFSVRRP